MKLQVFIVEFNQIALHKKQHNCAICEKRYSPQKHY